MIRELDRAEIDAFLHSQVVGRIGCHADGLTYVVPIIYAYDGECLYVASVEGQKTRMMRESPRVCFETDEYERGSWRSVIAYGDYEELAGEEAEHAVELLAERFGRSGSRRRHGSGEAPQTVCFRVRIREATGRAVTR